MVKSSTLMFDRKLASEYLDKNYNKNRPLRKSHASYLSDEMKKGRFSPTSIIAVAYLKGDCYLINGQHTLTAIQLSGTSHNLTLQEHNVSSQRQLAELYSRYDVGMNRKFTDSANAFELDTVTGMNITQLNRLSSCIRWVMGDMKATNARVSNEDMVTECLKWQNQARLFLECLRGVDSSISGISMSQPVMTAGIVTIKYRPQKAVNFWRQVFTDDGLKVGDARKTLNKFLLKNSLRESHASRVTVISKRQMFQACSRAWGKFYNNESLKLIKNLSERDVKLLGTPYDGTYESIV